MRRLGPPVLRRLTRSEIEEVVDGYQSGRSLVDIAQEFGIHHRTVADHLERLGVARRVNLPKMGPGDVSRAATRYRAGESLATVGKALNVDVSTVQRALKRAAVTIRPRRGC
jgi:transposase-like protein